MSMYDLDPLTGRSTTCSPASWLAEIGLVLVLERHNADCVRLPQWYFSCGNENKKKVVAKLRSTKVVAKYNTHSTKVQLVPEDQRTKPVFFTDDFAMVHAAGQ